MATATSARLVRGRPRPPIGSAPPMHHLCKMLHDGSAAPGRELRHRDLRRSGLGSVRSPVARAPYGGVPFFRTLAYPKRAVICPT